VLPETELHPDQLTNKYPVAGFAVRVIVVPGMTHPVNELNEVVPIKIVPAPTLVALNVNGGLSR
jgi:hypothetical protein